MRIQPISNFLFEKNRAKLSHLLPNKSVVILCANDKMPRNGDQFYPFRQESNFFYLTGIEAPQVMLVLCPDYPEVQFREILFIERINESQRLWIGESLNKDIAKEISGIDQIRYLDEFESTIQPIMQYASVIYLNIPTNEHNHYLLSTSNYRLYRRLKEQYPLHHYQSVLNYLTRLRLIKEKEEIEQIEQAIKITKKAFYEIIGMIEPGIHEYEIEAAITSEFLRNGVKQQAFEPIIAAGKNACVLHYTHNDSVCNDNDLVLVDFGAEYNNYCADITRTLPVNGHFSARQLQIYNEVLKLMNKAMQIISKGKTLREIQQAMIPFFEEAMLELNLLTEEEIKEKEGTNEPAYKKFFMHGISHFLGLDVHDVGSKDEPLLPGMVITCEPALYIPEENIGIRLENDLLITENGVINLSDSIPILPEEIEALFKN